MPLEEVFILILGRRILLMICESEDRLTGRVIIVVARTTDYCFLCNRKSFGISYCIKSPPGRILSYREQDKTGFNDLV